jgi:hypothetical protein
MRLSGDEQAGKENKMEDLTPPLLYAVRELRWQMNAGRAMKEAFQCYLDGKLDPLSLELRRNWVLKQKGGPIPHLRSHYAQSFWNLVERGLAGQPTHEALGILEAEVQRAAEAELDEHLAALPFKVLIPLLLFQFPAYLLLLLGPALRELNRQMGG